MKNREITLVGILAVVYSMMVFAQGSQAPKPGLEHKKLAVFLGSWSVDGELKPGNGYGVPAGKVSVVERYQWLPGEFFLQMNRDGKGAAGEVVRHMWIFGYDAVAKKHTVQFFELTNGLSASGTATNNGNTWMWSNNGRAPDGKAFQERCTITVVPTSSYTLKCETSADGKTWLPSFEGKATKSKS